jgi:predicted kinase
MPTDSLTDQVLSALTLPEQITATPVLFIISGLPGTGKSFLARRLAERLPLIIINSDFVRKILTHQQPTYSAEESALVHQVGRAVLKRLLLTGYHVLYDATNLAEWHREKLYRLADETNAKLVIIRTIAPEEIVRTRLRERFEHPDPHDYSDADWSVHEKLKAELEPVRRSHLVVDTSQDLEPAIRKILRAAR